MKHTVTRGVRRATAAFLGMWYEPTAQAIAERELEQTKRDYLKNQFAAEYHKQMNVVYENTIARLERYLEEAK